jgi:hypothetical protein
VPRKVDIILIVDQITTTLLAFLPSVSYFFCALSPGGKHIGEDSDGVQGQVQVRPLGLQRLQGHHIEKYVFLVIIYIQLYIDKVHQKAPLRSKQMASIPLLLMLK